MTLRLTREEAEWLGGVLMEHMSSAAINAALNGMEKDEVDKLRRDRDVATGLLGRLREGK